jgi:cell wall-associated NlpC family hydrolase
MGWGTPEQVTDPQYAARKFFSTLRGLGGRRFQMGMGEAAQAVQRSAYPGRYAERISEMRNMWPEVAQTAGSQQFTMDGNPYLPDMPAIPTPSVAQIMAPYTQEEPGAPTPDAMLGAWGMNSPLIPPEPEIDPMEVGAGTFISSGTTQFLQQTSGPYGAGVDGWRKAVIEAARGALGTPYAWGGNSLASGVDCSGLVQQAFARAGINLPRVSYQQANYGTRTKIRNLQPGDLVAWDNSSRNNGADHIAIYLGGGQIIEAPRPGSSVRIRSLGPNEGAWGVAITR